MRLRLSEAAPIAFGAYVLASTFYVVGYFRVVGLEFMQGITFADFLSFSWTGVPAFLIGLFPLTFLNLIMLKEPPTWEETVSNWSIYSSTAKWIGGTALTMEFATGLLGPAILSMMEFERDTMTQIALWKIVSWSSIFAMPVVAHFILGNNFPKIAWSVGV